MPEAVTELIEVQVDHGGSQIGWPDSEELKVGEGDLIRMSMGSKQGIFNHSGTDTQALFWAPPMRLYDLFVQLDGLSDPAEVVRIAAQPIYISCRHRPRRYRS